MSDHGTADPRFDAAPLPERAVQAGPAGPAVAAGRAPKPVAMLVVDVVTGTVTAANPAGRRQLSGRAGLELSRWVAGLATASGADAERAGSGLTVLRTPSATDATAPFTVWAECTPITFRSRPCLLVVLRADAVGHVDAGLLGSPRSAGIADATRAVFTLDALGRIDSWGQTAEDLTGFPGDVTIGGDTTLLHPAPARLSGEPHRALTEAYRNGEHRAEGWRVRGDGRLFWAEVVTGALHDGLDRLIGFATTMHDLTADRHLDRAAVTRRIPAPRPEVGAARLRLPAPRRPGLRIGGTVLRVPGQRRPAEG
jgi:PAS domain S-box-containing protein